MLNLQDHLQSQDPQPYLQQVTFHIRFGGLFCYIQTYPPFLNLIILFVVLAVFLPVLKKHCILF